MANAEQIIERNSIKKLTDLPIVQLKPADGRIREFLNANFYYMSTYITDHVGNPDQIYSSLLEGIDRLGAMQSGSREILLFSEQTSPDGYSGYPTLSFSELPIIGKIREKLRETLKLSFDVCLLNYYQDGSAAISMHSDKEYELVSNAPIASISFGAVRHFDIWPKLSAPRLHPRYRVDLEHGSLMVMGKDSQLCYLHGVPVQKRIKQPRINLTFRMTQRE